jgi:hypothetical protein
MEMEKRNEKKREVCLMPETMKRKPDRQRPKTKKRQTASDTQKKRRNSPEHDESVKLVFVIRLLQEFFALLNIFGESRQFFFTKTANGMFCREWSVINREKAEGLNGGLPDYLIIIPQTMLIYIELKSIKGGSLTKAQKDFLWSVLGIDDIKIRAKKCNGCEKSIAFLNQCFNEHLEFNDKVRIAVSASRSDRVNELIGILDEQGFDFFL